MLIGVVVLIGELILLSDGDDIAGKLGESSLNSLSDGSEEVKFLSSGLSGGLVLISNSLAEGRSIIEELLVSVSLGGGGEDDSSLGGDAFVEFADFGFKSFLLGGEGFNESGQSSLVFVVSSDGSLFSSSGFFVVSLDSGSEVGQHGLDSFEEGFISLEVLGGQLGEGGHNSSEVVNLSDLGGVLEHSVHVSGKLGEAGFSGPDLFEDEEGFIDGSGGNLVDLSAGLESVGLSSSGLFNEGQEVSVLGKLSGGDFQILDGSDSLGSASVEGLGGLLDGGVSLGDFVLSVGDFISTVSLLGGIELVVLGLFGGNFSDEVVQHSVNGVQWTSGLQLVLNLGQQGHDASLGGEVQWVLVEQGGGVTGSDQNNQADSKQSHF